MERLKRLFVVGALAVVVSVVEAGPAFAAKGGNNDTAKACQQGGWQTLVPNLGDRFANQGDCVNDGAKGSAPFGTAGKAACTDPHGINGSFSLDATHHTWSCFYDVPPNPRGDLSALVTACDTDAGTLLTLQLDASPLKNWAARCVNE
jgi:hypothetical protein